jgi:hypothetical protein
MNAELLAPGDGRWLRLLQDTRHEFYHLPGYVALEAQRIGGRAVALFCEDHEASFFLPLIVRQIPQSSGLCDATSPYGYPGPLIVSRNQPASEVVSQAATAALPVLRDNRWVSVFVRLSPVLNQPEDFSGFGTLAGHGSSVWLDLTLPADELQKHVRSRFRSYINSALRSGVTARFDDDWVSLREFVRLYHQTMRKVGAEQWYFLQPSYFESLREILGHNAKLCVVEYERRIVAAGLFALSDGLVQYLFSGTDDTAGQPHATKVMMTFVRDWARASGHSVLHLGGGLGGGADDLLTFKRGFSKLLHSFHSWRWVIDAERYGSLVADWERKNGTPAGDETGYFPPYRKTLSPVVEDVHDASSGGDAAKPADQ